jgi:hypothetical protein
MTTDEQLIKLGAKPEILSLYRRQASARVALRAAGLHRGVWHLSLTEYNSVEAIARATDDDLLAVTSIGPKVLAEIRAVVPRRLKSRIGSAAYEQGYARGWDVLEEFGDVEPEPTEQELIDHARGVVAAARDLLHDFEADLDVEGESTVSRG